ncbi:hypothetical protein OG705_29730 [Streptomyces sp. NBC_00838]|uniref:hypothetical protein n=1 Tax=Streptomyces sp. NBC_00838 TaxID=2903680 RepID=UPI003865C4FB|nr:hypothetical protein OG705_29730 [Streptomyces sp. NBC_00838]
MTTATHHHTTMVDETADLLRCVADELPGDHHAGRAVQLLTSPCEMAVEHDEVVAEEFNAEQGVWELRPRKLYDVSLTDAPHTAQETDLLKRLKAILDDHPAGRGVQLIITDGAMVVDHDELVVQVFNPGRCVWELLPYKRRDISPTDVLHIGAVTDPRDKAFVDYATTPRVGDYWEKKEGTGLRRHWWA